MDEDYDDKNNVKSNGHDDVNLKRSSREKDTYTDQKLTDKKKDPKKVKKLYKKLRPKSKTKLDKEGSEESIKRKKKRSSKNISKTGSNSKLPGEIRNGDSPNRSPRKDESSKNGEDSPVAKSPRSFFRKSPRKDETTATASINGDNIKSPRNGEGKEINVKNLSRKSKTLEAPLKSQSENSLQWMKMNLKKTDTQLKNSAQSPRQEEDPTTILLSMRSKLKSVDKKVEEVKIDSSNPVSAVSLIRKSIRDMNNNFQESVVTPSQYRNLLKSNSVSISPIPTTTSPTTETKQQSVPLQKTFVTKSEKGTAILPINFVFDKKNKDVEKTTEKYILSNIEKKIEKKIEVGTDTPRNEPPEKSSIKPIDSFIVEKTPEKSTDKKSSQKKSSDKISLKRTSEKLPDRSTDKNLKRTSERLHEKTSKSTKTGKTTEKNPSKNQDKITDKTSEKVAIPEKVIETMIEKIPEQIVEIVDLSPRKIKIIKDDVPTSETVLKEKTIELAPEHIELIPQQIEIQENIIGSDDDDEMLDEEPVENKSNKIEDEEISPTPSNKEVIEAPSQDIKVTVTPKKKADSIDFENVDNIFNSIYAGTEDEELPPIDEEMIEDEEEIEKVVVDNNQIMVNTASLRKTKDESTSQSSKGKSSEVDFDNIENIFNSIYSIDDPKSNEDTSDEIISPTIMNKDHQNDNLTKSKDTSNTSHTSSSNTSNTTSSSSNTSNTSSSSKSNGSKDDSVEPEDKKKKTIIKKIIRKVVKKKCKNCGSLNSMGTKLCKCGEYVNKKSNSEIRYNKNPPEKKPIDEIQEPLANFSVYSVNFKNGRLLDILNTIPKESIKSCLANYDNEDLYNYMTDSMVIKKMIFLIFFKEEIVYAPQKRNDYEYLPILHVKDYICDIICNKEFDDILDTIVNDRTLSTYLFSHLKKDPIVVDEMDGAVLHYYKNILSAIVQSKFVDFQVEMRKPNSHIISNLMRLIHFPPIIELLNEITSHDSEFVRAFPQIITKAVEQIQINLATKNYSSVHVLLNFMISLINTNKVDPNELIEILGKVNLRYMLNQIFEDEFDIFIELFEVIFSKLHFSENDDNGKYSSKTPHPYLLKYFSSDEFYEKFRDFIFNSLKNHKISVKCFRFLELLSCLILCQSPFILNVLHSHNLFFLFMDFFFEFIWNSMLHNLVFSTVMRILTSGNKVYNQTISLLFVKYRLHEKIMEAFKIYYPKESIEEVKNLVYPVPKAGFMDHLLKIAIKVGDALLKKSYLPEDVIEEIKNSDWIFFSQNVLLPFILLKK